MEGIYSKLQKILMAHFESAAGNPSHNGRVCSTWGNFHFKNFDGDIFYFPGVCNYIFASNCKSPYEDFNIQIRRTMVENATVITHVIMRLEGAVVELTRTSVLVNGKQYVHIFYYELKLLGLLSFPEGSLSKHPFSSSDLILLPVSWRVLVLPEASTKIRVPDSELHATSADYPCVHFVQRSYIPAAAPLQQLSIYSWSYKFGSAKVLGLSTLKVSTCH